MEKLRGKGIVDKNEVPTAGMSAPTKHEALPAHAIQLPVDVFQSDDEIVIYAQLAGMDMQTLDVSISGENDVVSIHGAALRPEHMMYEAHNAHNGEFTLEECHWGDFYRQIILPDQIDPEHAEAKTKDGVFALRLPLVDRASKGLKLNVVRVDDHAGQV